MAQVNVQIESIAELSREERELFSDMRALALGSFPYFGQVAFRLPVRSAPGLGTNIITQSGLIVCDFEVVKIWGVRASAAHLAHLWMHWVFDHGERAKAKMDFEGVVYQSVWNIASDCSVVCNFRTNGSHSGDKGLVLPPDMPYREYYNITGDTTEELYDSLLDKLISEKYGEDSNKDELTVDDILNAGKDGDPGQSGQGQGQGEPSDQYDGDGDGDGDGEGQGQGSGSPGQPNAGQGPTYCGSGAGNAPLDNEGDFDGAIAGSENDSLVPGWERSRLQRATAEEMRQYSQSKGIGTLPGDMERWVEEILAPPAVDWRTKLRNRVRQPLIRKAGITDYTYARLPRHKMNGGIIMPRMTAYTPGKVGVFIDTSGSMSQWDLAEALKEVKGILAEYDVIGYSVDVGVNCVGPLKSTSEFRLTGGGGTDMSNAIYRAAEDKLEVAVVLTDGETPWPRETPRRGLFVVAGIITHQNEDDLVVTHVPDWIDAVHIPATHGR